MTRILSKLAMFLLISFFVGFAMVFPALAAIFEVSPVRLEFNAASRTDILMVKNEGDEKLSLQLKGFQWSQGPDGKDIYTDTKEIIFFPRLLTLEAKEERIVRVGIRTPPGDKEKTYRIYLEELLGDKPIEGTAVRTLVRMGIPVFVAPTSANVKALLKELKFQEGGKVSFEVSNEGNVHFVVQSITVNGYNPSGKEIFSDSMNGWYLHAGSSKKFVHEIPGDLCSQISRVQVEISTDKSSLSEGIDAVQAMCKP